MPVLVIIRLPSASLNNSAKQAIMVLILMLLSVALSQVHSICTNLYLSLMKPQKLLITLPYVQCLGVQQFYKEPSQLMSMCALFIQTNMNRAVCLIHDWVQFPRSKTQ